MSDEHEEKIKTDLKMVAQINEGDDQAWSAFVERYTDWTLYKAKEWCTTHCSYHSGAMACGLYTLQRLRKGEKNYSGDRPECDEGMDSYIWIFEKLRKRIARYSGKNGCLLSTFVWTILNSREFYIDWLRWKYGRAF